MLRQTTLGGKHLRHPLSHTHRKSLQLTSKEYSMFLSFFMCNNPFSSTFSTLTVRNERIRCVRCPQADSISIAQRYSLRGVAVAIAAEALHSSMLHLIRCVSGGVKSKMPQKAVNKGLGAANQEENVIPVTKSITSLPTGLIISFQNSYYLDPKPGNTTRCQEPCLHS